MLRKHAGVLELYIYPRVLENAKIFKNLLFRIFKTIL